MSRHMASGKGKELVVCSPDRALEKSVTPPPPTTFVDYRNSSSGRNAFSRPASLEPAAPTQLLTQGEHNSLLGLIQALQKVVELQERKLSELQSRVESHEATITRLTAQLQTTEAFTSAFQATSCDTSAQLFSLQCQVHKDLPNVIADQCKILHDRCQQIETQLQPDALPSPPLHNLVVQEVEKQVSEVKDVAERLDRARRANNVIIWGLPEDTHEEIHHKVRELFSHKLQLPSVSLNRVIRFGRPQPSKPRPVLCVIQSSSDRQAVLNSKTKLRGTSIYVHPDLTPHQQQQRRDFIARSRQGGVQRMDTRGGF